VKTQLERVICPMCGKNVAARVPAGGDGTGLRPVMHKDRAGARCKGRFALVNVTEVIE
jgi:hypothetical protein